MRLEDRLQGLGGVGLRDCVDLYAGTSTGAIIALALGTTDLPLPELNELYGPAHAQQIFAENRGWFEIDGVNAPRYESTENPPCWPNAWGRRALAMCPRISTC